MNSPTSAHRSCGIEISAPRNEAQGKQTDD
jgi:hypothetical protein